MLSMETNKNYSSIRSLAQLERALDSLETQQNMTMAKMGSDYRHVKNFYSPANLYNFILDKISPVFNLIGLALDAYDRMVEKIAARRTARKSLADKAENTAEEVPQN